jgi:hypothetical protein
LSIFGVILGIITLLYGILNMPSVQETVKEHIVTELKAKLNTELGIEKLHFQPFNTLELENIYILDLQNRQLLNAGKLYARINLFSLLRKDIVVTAIRLGDFELNLSKETADAPLNIQFIIDAFKPENDSGHSAIDLKINSINLNNGCFCFDVEDKPANSPTLFDANHIQLSDIQAHLALKSLKSDSLNIQLNQLSMKEKSGFSIGNLALRLVSQGKKMQLKGFKLETAKSLLQLSKCDIDLSNAGSPAKLGDISLDCAISSSYITPKDIAVFSDALKNFDDRIYLNCLVSGTVNDLDITKLSLDYGDKMQLLANTNIVNLLCADSLYLSGNVSSFHITGAGIEGLVNNFSADRKILPPEIANLGTVSFNGNISGYLKKLRAHGIFQTDPGSVVANLDFGFAPQPGFESFFTGSISSEQFMLGQMLKNDLFNELSFKLDINMEKHAHTNLIGKIKGTVGHFDYRGYPYRNIELDGIYDGPKMEGKLSLNDENVSLAVNGLFDFSKKQPTLNFMAKLRNLRPDKLNLSEKYANTSLSLNMDANFTGKDIDNADGYLQVDSLRFFRGGDLLRLNKILLEASGELDSRKLEITSDIVNGSVSGKYSFLIIGESLKQTLHPYLPALIENSASKQADKIEDCDLNFNFTVNNTETLSRILDLPFTIYSPAKIIGFYNNSYNKFRTEVFYPSGKIAGTTVKSVYLLAENSKEKINAAVTGLFIGKNNVQNDVALNIAADAEAVKADIDLTNNSKQKFEVALAATAKFIKEDSHSPLLAEIDILPRKMVLNDTLWMIEKSHIRAGDGGISINNLTVRNTIISQSVTVNGAYYQSNPQDTLKVELNKINLEYLFNTLAIDALSFGGAATGTLNVSNNNGAPFPHINLTVDGFQFNKAPLGRLNLYSELEEKTGNILLKGTILNDERRQTGVNGYINPAANELSINFDANRLNLAFLNKYTSSLFNNIAGLGTGRVRLFGDLSDVTVEGKALVENGKLGIKLLNADYTFSDTIYLRKDLIYFNNMTLYDQYNNSAQVSGRVAHNYFSDFAYNIELVGSNFLLYNVTEKQNPTFSGRAFVSGLGSVRGDEQAVNIDARFQTNSKTSICMNFMKTDINNYSFITYKTDTHPTDDSLSHAAPVLEKAIKTDSGMDVNMNFYINATPEATVELVMDPVGGDKLNASGSGAIQFVWGTKTAPKLYGTYTIDKGSYNFTFQKILERCFNIQNGSAILFQGDPFRANLDVTASYKVNANLKDLDQDLARNTGQTNIPVECVLNISNELQHPNIGLDIALPTADPEVQRQVKNLLNNQDMINRQMVYLLLLSKFYTPDYFNVEQRTNDFASVASATLSSQLSKILSRIDNRWQFGTNIRASDANFNETEVELLMSGQLLNDRILFNGNFGYRSFDNSASSTSEIQQDALIHDIDVEVLLNRIGTWRLKVYNHYNEKYYITRSDKSQQTQGVGLLYKRDFDSLSDLLNAKEKKTAIKRIR